MTSHNFCYWLQGFFELGNTAGGLNPDQVEMIKRHLSLVFVHEIDPSQGPKEVQEKLQAAHDKPQGGDYIRDEVYRC